MSDAKFVDIDPRNFPFVVEFFSTNDPEGLESVNRFEVTGPGALAIPPMRKAEGDPYIWCRITWADGTVMESPRGQSEIQEMIDLDQEDPTGGWCAPSP